MEDKRPVEVEPDKVVEPKSSLALTPTAALIIWIKETDPYEFKPFVALFAYLSRVVSEDVTVGDATRDKERQCTWGKQERAALSEQTPEQQHQTGKKLRFDEGCVIRCCATQVNASVERWLETHTVPLCCVLFCDTSHKGLHSGLKRDRRFFTSADFTSLLHMFKRDETEGHPFSLFALFTCNHNNVGRRRMSDLPLVYPRYGSVLFVTAPVGATQHHRSGVDHLIALVIWRLQYCASPEKDLAHAKLRKLVRRHRRYIQAEKVEFKRWDLISYYNDGYDEPVALNLSNWFRNARVVGLPAELEAQLLIVYQFHSMLMSTRDHKAMENLLRQLTPSVRLGAFDETKKGIEEAMELFKVAEVRKRLHETKRLIKLGKHSPPDSWQHHCFAQAKRGCFGTVKFHVHVSELFLMYLLDDDLRPEERESILTCLVFCCEAKETIFPICYMEGSGIITLLGGGHLSIPMAARIHASMPEVNPKLFSHISPSESLHDLVEKMKDKLVCHSSGSFMHSTVTLPPQIAVWVDLVAPNRLLYSIVFQPYLSL